MFFDTLPSDPVMLLSFVNTRLRDQYGSLQELCEDMHVDANDICTQLAAIGYEYDSTLNKFV